ncbi:MAG: hypothetical protein EOP83_31190 [Verrucomicrobiaceae bacterium]|nr:MAG: hypothetical protein EOP83_31190 [Verrucomicrobiaceae bacterium]
MSRVGDCTIRLNRCVNPEPTLEFLAIRLLKGGRKQFVANWSLRTILMCLGSMAQDATHGCGLRLNHPRARKLANQWLAEKNLPFTSPLIVAIESPALFTPLSDFPDSGFGMIRLPLSGILDVADGIHRLAALRQMNLSRQILARTEWPIELIECIGGDDIARLNLQVRGKEHPRKKPNNR